MSGKLRGLPPKPEVLEREAEVLKLRRGGLPFDLIAQRTGYAAASGAKAAYDRAMARLIYDDAEALRKMGNDRLDMGQSAIWGKVLQGDIPAINAWLKIEERRAKLNGLDQPVRIQAEVVTYDANSIQAELARIYTTYALTADSSEAVQVGETTGEADTAPAE